MFDYTVSNEANNALFNDACKKIEQHLGFTHQEPSVDVDGSAFIIYEKDGCKIRIDNDFFVDAVFIESTVDLSPIFS